MAAVPSASAAGGATTAAAVAAAHGVGSLEGGLNEMGGVSGIVAGEAKDEIIAQLLALSRIAGRRVDATITASKVNEHADMLNKLKPAVSAPSPLNSGMFSFRHGWLSIFIFSRISTK